MRNRVVQRRSELGLTQVQLASLSGLSRQSISAIEAGSESPRLQVAQRLATALSTTLDYLFGDDEAGQVAVGVYLGYLNGRSIVRSASRSSALSHFPNGLLTSGESTLVDRPFVFVDGCDPILAFLTRVLSEEGPFRYLWTSMTNNEVIESVLSNNSHLGLVHYGDGESVGELPVGLSSFALADWNLVLATKPGSAFKNIEISSLGDESIKFALRKSGSGVRRFYDSIAGGSSISSEAFDGHQDVADAVRFGNYDATLTMESIASASELDFRVVQTQRSYLIAKNRFLDLPEVSFFIERATAIR